MNPAADPFSENFGASEDHHQELERLLHPQVSDFCVYSETHDDLTHNATSAASLLRVSAGLQEPVGFYSRGPLDSECCQRPEVRSKTVRTVNSLTISDLTARKLDIFLHLQAFMFCPVLQEEPLCLSASPTRSLFHCAPFDRPSSPRSAPARTSTSKTSPSSPKTLFPYQSGPLQQDSTRKTPRR
ncbi:hypothetical protein GOODEAATRI_022781 [Goodea atripinnis]|uniref:Uncharacterized protein n=1 Tax=Goodea atripinnis TaxID=208336 RepID=A0ABV0N3P1_9TELE